jgi:hypothetical protein
VFASSSYADLASGGDGLEGVVVERGDAASGVSTVFSGVAVYGRVYGDVLAASGAVLVRGPVTGKVRSGLGAVEIQAPVGGDVESAFGDVLVDSRVDGDVDVSRGDLLLGPEARISGHVFVADGRIIRDEDSVVRGAVLSGADFTPTHVPVERLDPSLLVKLLAALLFVACAVPAAAVARWRLPVAAGILAREPLRSLLAGVVSSAAVVVTAAVLAISVVGLPLLLLLLPAYLALALAGALTTAYYLGRGALLVAKLPIGGYVSVTVAGATLASALFLTPVVGSVIPLALALPGSGAVALAVYRAGFGLRAPPR